MKKIFMMAALFIGTYTITSAQDQSKGISRPTQEQQAEKQTAGMEKKLGLSPQQRTKVYELNMEYLGKMKTARADKNIKIQDIHSERNNKLKAILTKEQQAKWEANTKDRMRGRNEDRKAKLGEPQERNKSVKGIEKSAQ